MTEQADYLYDVFISYSPTDREWVWETLLPRLENAGLKVILDERDFEPGAPLVKEKERAVLQSRKTLLVLSPAYVAGDWTEFESVLVQTLDPAARKRRLIPVVRVPCRLDLRIRPLVAVDLTAGSEVQWQRLRMEAGHPAPPAANEGVRPRGGGNASAWRRVIPPGTTPVGQWTLTLLKEAGAYFQAGEIDDILFIITFAGRLPPWPE